LNADKFSTSSQGSGVNGYALFQNMGTTFNKEAALEIRKHAMLNFAILSSSDDWTSLATSGGSPGFSGFADGVPYVLQFALERTGTNALVVGVSWSNTVSGATLAASATDNVATNFSFDGIALRPSGNGSTAAKIIFSEVKVELAPGPAPAPAPAAKHP